MRKSSWARFYLRRHVQAVEGDKTMSLLVNAETGNAPAEYHTLPPRALGQVPHTSRLSSGMCARRQREARNIIRPYPRRRMPDRAHLTPHQPKRAMIPFYRQDPDLN